MALEILATRTTAESALPDTAQPAAETMVARYTLHAAVLPLVHRTVAVAHQVRRALLSRFAQLQVEPVAPDVLQKGTGSICRNGPEGASHKLKLSRCASPLFAGKDRNSQPLHGHRHAYYLPTDEDGDGRLDHVSVCAARRFETPELAALIGLRRLTLPGRDAVALVLHAVAEAAELRAPLVAESTEWISATPFIVTRHAKPRGRRRDPPELIGRHNRLRFARQVLLEEIARLLERRPELPRPIAVEPLPDQRIGPQRLAPHQFQRQRKASDDSARRPCGAFRIVFPTPVRGPICLGLHSHFGLGLFVPAEKETCP
jgi:CRISPR-associated protein Csb2